MAVGLEGCRVVDKLGSTGLCLGARASWGFGLCGFGGVSVGLWFSLVVLGPINPEP